MVDRLLGNSRDPGGSCSTAWGPRLLFITCHPGNPLSFLFPTVPSAGGQGARTQENERLEWRRSTVWGT